MSQADRIALPASAGSLGTISDPRERVWRRYTLRLSWFALGTLVAALPLWRASKTVDGRDPFYVAMAIQFVVWGATNAVFAARGLIELRALRRHDDARRASIVAEQTTKIIRLLRVSRLLNRLWLAIAVALLLGGYLAWSPSLCGHGFAMLVQAVGLTLIDRGFLRALVTADAGQESEALVK